MDMCSFLIRYNNIVQLSPCPVSIIETNLLTKIKEHSLSKYKFCYRAHTGKLE